MPDKMNRRGLLQKSLISLTGAGAIAAHSLEEQTLLAALDDGIDVQQQRSRSPASEQLPMGKIGDLRMSRVILGGNLIGGWAHSRDLIYVSNLFKAYNTESEILETLELAEERGINTICLTGAEMKFINKYNDERGGEMQTVCQIHPKPDDPRTNIDQAIDAGATTCYIQGGTGDNLIQDGHIDLVGKTVDYIRGQGLLAGVGGHSLEVIKACEEAKVDPDYYVKSFHPDNYWSHPRENRSEFEVDRKRFPDHDRFHDNLFDVFPDQTKAYMQQVKKPWIAFKVLAAGAIRPLDGLKFAFENGADFVFLGMFDFQIIEDTIVAKKVLASVKDRERPWLA